MSSTFLEQGKVMFLGEFSSASLQSKQGKRGGGVFS